jgi:hypothetical protein
MSPVPGLHGGLMMPRLVHYAEAEHYDVDVFADAGSIVKPMQLQVIVASGTLMKSSDASIPSMSFVGFHPDSDIVLVNLGTIEPRGGAGGDAWVLRGMEDIFGLPWDWFICGSGGGGVGCDTSAGGLTADVVRYPLIPTAQGTDGSPGTPGTGGASDTDPNGFDINVDGVPPGDDGFRWAGGDGRAGGDAIRLGDADLAIYNASGFILAGGGGGAGGTWKRKPSGAPLTLYDGKDGGANSLPGEDQVFPADPLTVGGVGGFAVRYAGDGEVYVIDGFNPPEFVGSIGE